MRLDARVLPFAGLGLLVPPFAVAAPQSLVLLLALAGVVSLVAAVRSREALVPARALWAIGALVVWCAVGALWSIEPRTSILSGVRLATLAFVGVHLMAAWGRLDAAQQRLVGGALVVGLAVAVVALLLEYGGPHLVSRLVSAKAQGVLDGGKSVANRSAGIIVLLGGPAVFFALAAAWRWPAAVLAVLMITAVLISDNSTARVALAAALLAFAATMAVGRAALIAGRVVAVLLVVALPILTAFIPDPHLSYGQWGWQHASLHHRLSIWRFVGERIAEKPVLGWGMDAARTMPGGEDSITVTLPDGTRSLEEQLLPLHPHNAILQVWLELGLPGALALAALLWWVIGRVGHLPSRSAQAFGLGAVMAGLIIACASFGFWQSWWQAALWISAAMANGLLRWKPAQA